MRGEIDRLALVMPPGSTKSTFASILYPAWYLARGGAAIIAASHTAELAERWGRPVQASGLAHQVCTWPSLCLLRGRPERQDDRRHVYHLAAQVGHCRVESAQKASGNTLIDPMPFAPCSHSSLQDAIESKVIFRCTKCRRLVTEKEQNPPRPFDVSSHRFSFVGFP